MVTSKFACRRGPDSRFCSPHNFRRGRRACKHNSLAAELMAAATFVGVKLDVAPCVRCLLRVRRQKPWLWRLLALADTWQSQRVRHLRDGSKPVQRLRRPYDAPFEVRCKTSSTNSVTELARQATVTRRTIWAGAEWLMPLPPTEETAVSSERRPCPPRPALLLPGSAKQPTET